MLAPVKVPRDILTQLNTAVVKSLNDPAVRERFAGEGVDVVGNSPADFGEFLRKEAAKWASVIKASGIRIE